MADPTRCGATPAGHPARRHALGTIERGALLTRGAEIAWVGPEVDLAANLPIEAEHDLGGALMTPGLVDCHTHLVYGGRRADEFELRLQGASYEQIARAGGGIRSTVAATRAAERRRALRPPPAARARRLVAGGVTTLEIKSGYGPVAEDEGAAWTPRAASAPRRSGPGAQDLPRRARLPPSSTAVPTLHRRRLRLDARTPGPGPGRRGRRVLKTIGFTPAQTGASSTGALARDAGEAARRAAVGPGRRGARREFGALSCDHLEVAVRRRHRRDGARRHRRRAAARRVLLPARDETAAGRGCARPACRSPSRPTTTRSSPALSLPLMIHMACSLFRLTPERRCVARRCTVRALGLADRGTLAAGQRADFAVWDLEHPNELAYWFGHDACRRGVIAAGRGGLAMTSPASVFTLHRGTTPLLVSLPHVGTEIGPEIAAHLLPHALAVPDTDWHLEALYAFARDELGAKGDRAALVALLRRPESPAREHADVRRRQQHRAVPPRGPSPARRSDGRRGARRCRGRSPPRATLLAFVPRRACRRARSG